MAIDRFNKCWVNFFDLRLVRLIKHEFLFNNYHAYFFTNLHYIQTLHST